jgi:hypothetical protein
MTLVKHLLLLLPLLLPLLLLLLLPLPLPGITSCWLREPSTGSWTAATLHGYKRSPQL